MLKQSRTRKMCKSWYIGVVLVFMMGGWGGGGWLFRQESETTEPEGGWEGDIPPSTFSFQN